MTGLVFPHLCRHSMLPRRSVSQYRLCTLIARGSFRDVFLISQLINIVSCTYFISRFLWWNGFYVFSTFSSWIVYIFTWSWCVIPLYVTKFYLLFCYVIYVYIHEGYWSHTFFDYIVFGFWHEGGVSFIEPIEKPFFLLYSGSKPSSNLAINPNILFWMSISRWTRVCVCLCVCAVSLFLNMTL